ncbi:MAG: hypothetical protein ACRELX_16220, partial [Longimicrobiales bacterium]
RFPPVTPESVRVATPVTLRDVPATMLDVAGIDDTPIPGASLVTTWSGRGEPSSPLYSEVREAVRIPARYPNADADVQSLFANGLHYIRELDGGDGDGSDGGEELYRYPGDPGERHDLVENGGAVADVTWLRQALERHLGKGALIAGDPGFDARH